MTRTILDLGTDAGLVGLGECGVSSAAGLFNGKLGRQMLGMPVDDPAAFARLCRVDNRNHGSIGDATLLKAFAAIELALLDLQGKAAGVPVFKLLGGAVRPRAEFGAYAYACHLETSGLMEQEVPAAMAKYAVDAVTRTGARLFEFKIGRFAIKTDVASIRAVRAALGDGIALGVDANQALTLDGARQLLRSLGDARLDWFEEPVTTLTDMTRLHDEFPHVALSSHCTDPEKMKFYPAIEGIVGDLQVQGGIQGLMRSAAGFAALGRQFWQRACLEAGIAWAAMVHAGIACPDLTHPSQCLIDLMEDDLILGPRWSLREGGVVPPDLPGLGVELDRDALERYAKLFRSHGEFSFFDQA